MTLKIKYIDVLVCSAILIWSIQHYDIVHRIFHLDRYDSTLVLIVLFVMFTVFYFGLRLLWDKAIKDFLLHIFNNLVDPRLKNLESQKKGEEITLTEEQVEESANEEDLSLDLQCRYTMHYIGEYIENDEKEILMEDLRLMAYEEKIMEQTTPFKQICKGSLRAFDQKDMNHLGHAIGNHTLKKRNINEIAVFLKYCFPQVYKGTSIPGISQKLTSMEYPNGKRMIIPVADKTIPLPYFDE